MKVILDSIQMGGSGTGFSHYNVASHCGRKAVLLRQIRESEDVKPPTEAQAVGIIFHALADIYHTKKTKNIVIRLDDVYLQPAIPEAMRLFEFYTSCTRYDDFGKVVGAEIQFEGPAVNEAMGVSPITGRADLVVEMGKHDLLRWQTRGLEVLEEGIYIVDHKTVSRKDANAPIKYGFSNQFLGYPMMWNAMNPDKPCKGMIANVIIRHKKLEVRNSLQHFFTPMASLEEQLNVGKFLQLAKKREEENACNLAECTNGYSPCQFLLNGVCNRR